jgi:type IV secretory pathway VirB2 component (pilin)
MRSNAGPVFRSLLRPVADGLAMLLLTVACLGGFIGWRLGGAPTMASVVQTSLERKVVRQRLSLLVADEISRLAPDLRVDRAELVNMADAAIGSQAFRAFLEFAIESIQHEVATGQLPPKVNRADELYATVAEVLRTQRPDLAQRLPRDVPARALDLTADGWLGRLIRSVRDLRPFAAIAFAFGFALNISNIRRRDWQRLGLVVSVVALLITGVTNLSPWLIAQRQPTADRNAVLAIAASVLGPLRTTASLVAVIAIGLQATLLIRRRLVTLRPGFAATSGITVTVLFLTVAIVATADRDRVPQRACLGSTQLCKRRFDTITLAGTHNSMNAVHAGFLIPEHRLDIREQLDSGIRALLIDTHPGLAAADGIVWTDINLSGTLRQQLVDLAGENQVARAEQLRRRNRPTGPREIYLCHNLCELGATRYSDALTVIRRWLLAHRGDIVVLFVQDESSQADNIAAIRAAGLEGFAFRHRFGEPWPTVEHMIRDGQRLFILAEHHGGGAPFYVPGFPTFQDTSFDVPNLASLNCGRNRGLANSPLFLLNHWIETELPSPQDALILNQRKYIVDRAIKCGRERHRMPNIIAVDFSDEGDVRGAVDQLNAGP